MRADLCPLQMLLFTVSGWVNRHQQDVIAYLVEEDRVLKEQLVGRRLRLADEQRRRLAAKAKRDDAEGLAESVFEMFHAEPTVYLLPEYEDPSSQHEVLEEFWPGLFEAMLEGWVTDEACWPKNRNLEMFSEWFEVQMSSIVHDLYLDEPLEYIE